MRQKTEPFTGTHALANFIDCDNKMSNLSSNDIQRFIESISENHGLKVLGGYYHDFDSKGALTGVCVLAESHISVHTWPELNYATVDVFLCNYNKDNTLIVSELLDEISDFFKAKTVNSKLIKR
ncbi:MAG: adenosylmethionine decarboxylase [Patescibacteria group bacterium]